jgi:hypothetical protein
MPPATSKSIHPLVNTPIHNAHDPACATLLLIILSAFSVLSILSVPGMVFFAPGCHVRRAPPSSTFHIRCSAFATSIFSGLVRREVSPLAQIPTFASPVYSNLYRLSMPAFPYNMPRCFYHPTACAIRCLNHIPNLSHNNSLHANIPHIHKLHILNSLLRILFRPYISNLISGFSSCAYH